METALFIKGDFVSAAGKLLDYKIDCDKLTLGDWKCLAYIASKRLPRFGRVIGVPRGGLMFAS